MSPKFKSIKSHKLTKEQQNDKELKKNSNPELLLVLLLLVADIVTDVVATLMATAC